MAYVINLVEHLDIRVMLGKKSNYLAFMYNFYNKSGHPEPYYYAKLNYFIGSMKNNSRHLKTINAPRPKEIWLPKEKN